MASDENKLELWEQQTKSGGSWSPDNSHGPWLDKTTQQVSKSPEEYQVLPDYCWVSNWKIEKKDASTSPEGWSYASRYVRWSQADRVPRAQPKWNDTVRRRLWTRTMRKEFSIGSGVSKLQTADMSRVIPRMQLGLENIHKARKKIELIMKEAGKQAAQSDLMLSNVLSVRKTIQDLLKILEQLEKLQGPGAGTHIAHIKKLKREVLKEEMAIDKALDSTNKFLPLSRSGSGAGSGSAALSPPMSPSSSKTSSTSASTSGYGSSLPASLSLDTSTNSSSSSFGRGSSVTSGKGAFNPTFPLHGGDQQDSLEDGGYINQSMHDQLIMQKLQKVDEATLMRELIDERNVEISKMHKGIVEINEMFVDLSRIVQEQQIDIDTIFNNTEESFGRTRDALKLIVKAEHHQSGCWIS